jgi:LacI family transcriptional regulator
MNDTSTVSDEKRRLVLEAADALGYTPNPAALSLLNKRTGGLGVLLPYVSGEFFADLLNGLDEAAQDNEHFLVVSTSHRQPTEFKAAMQAMKKRVDGLVIMAPELDDEGAQPILKSEDHITFINTYLDHIPVEEHPVEILNFDNFAGSYALTQHLIEIGHQRIAHIRGPSGAGDARERTRGYRAAMAEAGLASTLPLEFEGDYTQAAGYTATKKIIGTTPRPSAILAANDYCAMGVISALHEAGIAVPDEVAVTGFDGITSAQYTLPPLTTVQVPMHTIGYQAIDHLVHRLDDGGNGEVQRQVLPVELIVRESTVP